MQLNPNPRVLNLFPKCVALEMKFQKVLPTSDNIFSPPTSTLTTGTEIVQMFLTINFSGEQTISLPPNRLSRLFPDGLVKFGLSQGKLHIKLINSKIPLETIGLAKELITISEEEIQEEGSTEGNISTTPGVKIGEKRSKKFKTTQARVHVTGYNDSYEWYFKVVAGESVLEGILYDKKLGDIHIEAPISNTQVTATFTASKEDISLTAGQLGWTKDLSRNKMAIIERSIAIKIIAATLAQKPYMSDYIFLDFIYKQQQQRD